MTKSLCVLALALASTFGLVAQAPVKTHLKVGDLAPDFTLPTTAGKPVKLSEFRPAAFTGGCTKEMQAYQLGLDKFETADTQMFGISTDNSPSQKKFAEELKVAFPMLSDYVSKDYGILIAERGIDNRATFVIDIEEGSAAIDISGAVTACSRVAKKK